MSQVFVKKFQNTQHCKLEVEGYAFFGQFYKKIPALIDVTDRQIIYEDLTAGTIRQFISSVLAAGKETALTGFFTNLSIIANNSLEIRESEGGTRLFYLDRLGRLKGRINTMYEEWFRQNHTTKVNQQLITSIPSLPIYISQIVSKFTCGYTVASQGDLHERNILDDGTVIDFEGAGYNLISTDVATFVWHTLFAGNHFGPRYAQWAIARNTHKKISGLYVSENNTIEVSLDNNRVNLLRQYLEGYVDHLPSPKINACEVEAAVAFRLLTTFHLTEMSKADVNLSFALANLFLSKDISLNEKLNVLLGNREEIRYFQE